MADALALLEARLDYTAAQIEAMAQAHEGLHGSGGKMLTSGMLIRQEREQAYAKAGIRTKRPAGTGKPCGESHIEASKTCRKGAGQAAASVPSAGSSEPKPDLRPTLSQAAALDSYLQRFKTSGTDFTRAKYQAVLDYAQKRNLSDHELSAVIQYTRFSYRDVNAALRGLEPPKHADLKPDEALVHGELIRSALDKLPTVFQPVWRGVSMDPEHLAEFRVGRVGADLGFQSTTTESPFGELGPDGVARGFATGELDVARPQQVIFEYGIGHGARSIDRLSLSDEGEALVPPGRQFRVTEVSSFADELERRKGQREQWAEGITLIRLEAVDQRLDARRREAPGQLGLDLGGGPGTGKPCGEGHIAADLTCHKSGGGPPAKALRKALVTVNATGGDMDDGLLRDFTVHLSGGDDGPREIEVALFAAPWKYRRSEATPPENNHSTSVHQRAQELGAELGVKPRVVETSWGKNILETLDLNFYVKRPEDSGSGSLRRVDIGRIDGALVARNVFREMGKMLAHLPDGFVLTCSAYTQDGYGAQRKKMYEALGFRFPEGSTVEGMAIVKGGKIARKDRADAAADPFEEAFVAAALELPEFGGGATPTLDSLEARLSRLLGGDGGVGAADHLDALRLQPDQDLVHGAPLRGGGARLPRQDHAVAEAVGVGHRDPARQDQATPGAIDALEQRLARLDARVKQAPGQLGLDLTGGKGKPCGESYIEASKTCRKGGAAPAAKPLPPAVQRIMERVQARKAEEAAAKANQPEPTGLRLTLPDLAEPPVTGGPKTAPLVEGRPPQKALGGGAFGDTYLYQLSDGRKVVVKVDRLKNLDPEESDYSRDPEVQRRNMVTRELEAMTRGHQLGIAPQPLSNVQRLEDGRMAFAYEMVEGEKLWKDHRHPQITPEAFALLEQPGMRAKVAAELGRVTRAMADSGFEHGDPHGGNIILSPDGRITLIDWGYADQRDVSTPVARAEIELRQVALLGNMLGITGPIDRRGTGGAVKEAIDGAGPIVTFQRRIEDARLAERQVIRDYEAAWNKDPANVLADPGAAIQQATRLKRELGIDFREAEGMVGLEAPLTPEIKAKAAAARDAVFGERQLQLVRRMLDTHYKAWSEYAPV